MAAQLILIVDSDEACSKLASVLLQQAGFTVRTAGSAERAQEVLKSFQPQIILVDVQLPGLSGLELTRLLRLEPAYGAATILAMTSHTEPSDLAAIRTAGCDGHISKPIDVRSFVELVRQSTYGMHPRSASDGRDVLSETRARFCAEGLDQCTTILKQLRSGPGLVIEVVQRIVHHWADLGGTLGFPEISKCARQLELLLSRPHNLDNAIEQALETAHHLFSLTANTESKRPLELAAGLDGVRVGLAGFSTEEIDRVRSFAARAGIQVVLKAVESGWMERQDDFRALVINLCAMPEQLAPAPSKLRIPAVFICSHAALSSLSMLPARTFDFLLAPWDEEEVLIRVYRLIAKQAPAQALAAVSNPPEKQPCVLIADDDPNIIAIVADVLQQLGVECGTAETGQQALDAVHRISPDAIILDVDMPDLDGFEVLRRLRGNVVTANIPVLLLTAYRKERDVNRGIAYGANDYVTKPFLPMELANRVLKLTSRPRRQRGRRPTIHVAG